MDRVSVAARSQVMRSVHSKDTECEVLLRKELWRLGVRGWRNHYAKLKGRPDLAFLGARLAVFVDGCFWHACPECGRLPSSHAQYWSAKLHSNRERDVLVTATLRAHGWHVLRLWEHEVLSDVGGSALTVVARLRDLRQRESGNPPEPHQRWAGTPVSDMRLMDMRPVTAMHRSTAGDRR